MPPVLNAAESKVDGLAFLGLSLSRQSDQGHPDSETRQDAFDLNEVQDREYEFILSTDDNGWLVGGGEPGPPISYKLAAPDSAHVEIMRVGTYKKAWGGLSKETLLETMKSGKIRIPQVLVLPTAVVANGDKPPELEIRFDMDPKDLKAFLANPETAKLPHNWALRFIHNQLFRQFEFPSRFCPGAFHSTILRKAEFRSKEHQAKYFAKCAEAIKRWKENGPQALQAPEPGACNFASGIYLFTDRNNITHKFEPNFLPPYDTPDKRKIIYEFLKDEWDEKTLSWNPISSSWSAAECGGGSDIMPDKYTTCSIM